MVGFSCSRIGDGFVLGLYSNNLLDLKENKILSLIQERHRMKEMFTLEETIIGGVPNEESGSTNIFGQTTPLEENGDSN